MAVKADVLLAGGLRVVCGPVLASRERSAYAAAGSGTKACPAPSTRRSSLALREKAQLASEQAEGLAQAFADATGERLATKADLREEGSSLRADIARQGAELRGEIARQGADLRG
jgi:hypothetical protein